MIAIPDNIDDKEWREIENRTLVNIPLDKVHNEEEFQHHLLSKFFQGRSIDEVSEKQKKFAFKLWDRLEDVYEKEKPKEKKYITINLKEYPEEAGRFARALKFYTGILRLFNKGDSRKDIVRHYSTYNYNGHRRKKSTINRDITSLIKVGVLSRNKLAGRGKYFVKSNVYA